MKPEIHMLKAQARNRMREAEPRPVKAGLLFVLIVGVLSALSAKILSVNITPERLENYLSAAMVTDLDAAQRAFDSMSPSTPDSAMSFVLETLGKLVAAGFSLFALNTLRSDGASLGNLLDGFGRLWKLLLLVLLTSMLVAIGLNLLIIPGVLLYYRYRLAVYLLLDHPELNPLQCLSLSGRLMRGRKGRFFLLDLSFIGWYFLASLPISIGMAVGGLPALILGALTGAAVLVWVLPYRELCCAGFYLCVAPTELPRPEGPEDL